MEKREEGARSLLARCGRTGQGIEVLSFLFFLLVCLLWFRLDLCLLILLILLHARQRQVGLLLLLSRS